MLRMSWLLGWAAGCQGEAEVRLPDRPPAEPIGLASRFERMARVGDAEVVAPRAGAGGWVHRDGSLVRLDGAGLPVEVVDPGVAVDTLLDRTADGWLFAGEGGVHALAEAGELTSFAIAGEVLAGQRDALGGRALARVGEACALWDLGGALVEEPVSTCDLGGDLVAWPGEPVRRVAADAGIVFTLVPGQWSVRHDDQVMAGGRVLIDVAARAGVVVALSDDNVLLEFDPARGVVVAEHEVHRPVGVTRVQLADDGLGVVVSGPDGAAFFARHPSAPGYLLHDPDHPGQTEPGEPKPGTGGAVEILGQAETSLGP